MTSPLRLGVLGSGKGSNFRAIAEAIDRGEMHAEVRVVIADVESAGILELARARGLRGGVRARPGASARSWSPRRSSAWCELLREAEVELVVLAGYHADDQGAAAGGLPAPHHQYPPLAAAGLSRAGSVDAGAAPRACRRPAARCITSMPGWIPARSSRSARCPCCPAIRPATLHARIQVAEHALYPAGRIARLAQAARQAKTRPRNFSARGDCARATRRGHSPLPRMAAFRLFDLNPEQERAVRTTEGPLLILAGAGSGKTRVITMRAAYSSRRGSIRRSILAVTFTNKAANEMRERLAALVEPAQAKKVTMSTFHALCVRILRAGIDRLGYKKNFSIYDEGDQIGLIKKIITRTAAKDEKLEPSQAKNLISKAKNNGWSAPPDGDDADRRGFRALPGGAEDAERGRFRRSAAARGEAAERARRGAGEVAASASAT